MLAYLLLLNFCKLLIVKYYRGKYNPLEFKISLIPYTGSDNWIEPTLKDLHSLLNQDSIPEHNPNCDYCKYQLNTSID